jgi:hypothetical protein
MSSHEYHSLPPEPEEIITGFPPEINDNATVALTFGELDVLRRRELALQAVEALEEVLEVKINVPSLLSIAESEDPTPARLQARRALRCIKDIGEEDSPVVKAVGETGVYHYAEGVIQYGCGRHTYLGLMEKFDLSAEEVTSLYALREMIAEEINDDARIGFPELQKALIKVGSSMRQAAEDPDSTIAAFTAAGFFVNYNRGKIYDHPIFSSDKPAGERSLGRHIDNSRNGDDSYAWVRQFIESAGIHVQESAKE